MQVCDKNSKGDGGGWEEKSFHNTNTAAVLHVNICLNLWKTGKMRQISSNVGWMKLGVMTDHTKVTSRPVMNNQIRLLTLLEQTVGVTMKKQCHL